MMTITLSHDEIVRFLNGQGEKAALSGDLHLSYRVVTAMNGSEEEAKALILGLPATFDVGAARSINIDE